MKKIIKKLLCLFYRSFFIFKLKKNKIVFFDGNKEKFEGNLKEIFKYLQDKKQCILIELYNSNTKLEKYRIFSFFNLVALYHLATSSYIFSNTGFINFLPLRKNQQNIQLWHGAGAFKKFGYDEKNKKILNYNSITLLTVSSLSIINIYANAFGIEKEKVKNLGIPRADIFFKEDEKLKIKEKFFDKYPNLKNKKIIMYAPTFRDNDRGNFNLKLDINLMKEKLEKLGYILFLRLHPSIKKDNIQVDNKFSFNFGEYPQVSDLLIVSDILISDYSSIIFEFSIMKKPILFYSYDVEEYIKDRGFYYNYYDFIPNKINYTTDELVNSIINKEWDLERIEEFAKYFFNPFDGNSTERVLKEVGLWEEEK